MTDSIEDLESLYRLRYLSGVALSVMVYDHLLTLNEEFSNIWAAPNRDYFQKLMFVINRYYTEAMVMYVVYVCSGLANLDDARVSSMSSFNPSCRRFVWVFALTATIFTATTHFFITLRVYHSWDKRKRVAIILLVAFIIFMAAAAALAVISAVDVQPAIHFVSFLKACMVPDIPITFPFMMGTLLGFDLFIILVAFFNAFETPHKTHADVLDTLHRDGARSFIAIFLLRLGCLIVSVVGMPADCFGALSVMWTLTAIISSRIHLRVEGLKFTTLAFGSSFLVI
ncbi:hypothetical protein LENED_005955 [Lentinula edodes]|uniref:DUF6533 domain-containing protein n=1 Tax=Lentinula edodes TaxID=5353 RepID=A0A1Q3EAC9_LENED|nr:hypothetical protein LENED_005955 [Lentinula edodes]